MNTTPQGKHLFLLIFFFIISLHAQSQKLLESRQSSFFTYIYKIADKEAENIVQKDVWVVDSTFFHTLVDSFPTDQEYKRKLPQGHYLKAYTEKNKLKLSFATIQDFEVFILNNQADLSIQIYDLKGQIISDAAVSVKGKTLKFDPKTNSFLRKKSNAKGLLKVNHGDFTSFYHLNRAYNNSGIKRGSRKVLYGTPLKYIWIPINYVVHLPIDGVKSISEGRSQGTIYRTKNFFSNSYHKVACIFDDYHCYDQSSYKFTQKHTGYIVFNKAKYHPGDTVKLKSFLVNRKGKPINKPVYVELQTPKRNLILTELKPYRKGGYEFEFHLHDSLELQLDRNYHIALNLNEDKTYMIRSFRYEEYELSKIKLEVTLKEKAHFRDQKINLSIKGTDENDLNLLDARLEIILQPNVLNANFDDHVFLPDTLYVHKQKLQANGETEIEISDENFPKANFEYDLLVRLLNSENEAIAESLAVDYFFDLENFDIEIQADSIHFQLKNNGTTINKKVWVEATDNFGNSNKLYEGSSSASLAINPFYASYTFKTDSISETFDIFRCPSLLQCYSERTADSLFILVNNPRKIPFSYNIYKKNSEQVAGYSNTLNFKESTSSKENYFVSIQYLWGGKIKVEDYIIPLNDKKLNIAVSQPKLVIPGQKSTIELLVTDFKGNPVEDVDLTAYSMTKKFAYDPPSLPYLGKGRKNRSVINRFDFEDNHLEPNKSTKLNYQTWKLLAGLDSIEYYRFIYPENYIYTYRYPSEDTITQVAPFVVSKGDIQPVHVVYIDNKPVYFSWNSLPSPYSFQLDSGYHQIKLRTHNRSITIDSLYFKLGEKLILSLNEDLVHKSVKTSLEEPELSAQEQRTLYRYIFPYRNTFANRYAYIRQDDFIQLLSLPPMFRANQYLAGPVAGNVSFHLMGGYQAEFQHEPNLQYDFSEGLIKMRSVDLNGYPKYLNFKDEERSLSDVVLTKNSLLNQWEDYLNSKRLLTARYQYPKATSPGNGRLYIKLSGKEDPLKNLPLNLLMFRYDNHEFLRVYPGNSSLIHELKEGTYQLIFFYPGSSYHVIDSVFIQPNGLNFYEFHQPPTFKKDSFSIEISNIIEETLFKPSYYGIDEERELKQIFNLYQQQFIYTGEGKWVEGFVYESGSGDPLPGVNINIKGTNYGTVTDLNGFYSIKVPEDKKILSFSFIGFQPIEEFIGTQSILNVWLETDVNRLEEVVVMGYGEQTVKSLTSSITTVASQNYTGGIAEVSGNLSGALEGRVMGIQVSKDNHGNALEIRVRGASTIGFANTPLFIINGKVFLGDIAELDPSMIKSMDILKGNDAINIYGASAANGVVIFSTNSGNFLSTPSTGEKGAEFDESFFLAAAQSSSIRENFSDDAFWQPRLKTDKHGKVSFEVTFPDDVTSWETYYLAMNGNRQSGQTKSLIKSYKPLMAQLAVPGFLVKSDLTYGIGKALNYSPDSVEITTRFEVNEEIQGMKTSKFKDSIIDTLSILASDSLMIKYYLEKEDGYFDGEQRNIPVYPMGIRETTGSFHALNGDTTIFLSHDPKMGEVTLFAKSDFLDVLEEEIEALIEYKYSCNEQLASKLKALLAQNHIANHRAEKFKRENEVKRIIRLLRSNQLVNGMWGWWKGSPESDWISFHVLEALLQAENIGYSINLNKREIIDQLVWKLENKDGLNTRLQSLQILHLLNATISFKEYLSDLEKTKDLSLNSLLQITELKHLAKLPYNLDFLKTYEEKTLFGNLYYSENSEAFNLLKNDIQSTLIAYRLLKADTSNQNEKLLKIRNYLLEKRQPGRWQNTFQSAKIIETILPDVLGEKNNWSRGTLVLKGGIDKTFTDFPIEMKVDPFQNLEISKTGEFPLYISSSQTYWNESPSFTKNDFEIETLMNQDSTLLLIAGQETIMRVRVKVLKDADYVMINVPIPGGCSYTDKSKTLRIESHREYFKNETAIFFERLPKGEYTFEIKLMPRYKGTFTLNPAKIELMYFPTFSANNGVKKVTIK
ncbi:carboxypeptidase-like regulatory domain-containing protein [Pararhodonellum marinum]|uniref:carboxypeptidase-like regulatory domain-containing protein n=1 Tax=Pararhodonellum marinum TaxID=2755358 RepID=UPI00188EF76D|nr:carboxypeptidase-like regulatory domain-containing protein [Pararhodonellum marinum]